MPPPVKKKPVVAPPSESGSWIDWVAANWWLPAALLLLVLGALGFAAIKKRRESPGGDDDLGSLMDETHVADLDEASAKLSTMHKGNESFVVEESGPHQAPDFTAETGRFGDTGELQVRG